MPDSNFPDSESIFFGDHETSREAPTAELVVPPHLKHVMKTSDAVYAYVDQGAHEKNIKGSPCLFSEDRSIALSMPELNETQARQFMVEAFDRAERATRLCKWNGSTLSCVYFNPDTAQLTAANVGDSPIYLVVKDGDEVSITNMHTEHLVSHEERKLCDQGANLAYDPEYPEGPLRVFSVTQGYGGLMMSRSMGDNGMGGVDHTPDLAQPSGPDLKKILEDPSKEAFLINASDGLRLDHEALKKVFQENAGKNTQELADALSEANRSEDDVTIHLLNLKKIENPALLIVADGHGDEDAKAAESCVEAVGKLTAQLHTEGTVILEGKRDTAKDRATHEAELETDLPEKFRREGNFIVYDAPEGRLRLLKKHHSDDYWHLTQHVFPAVRSELEKNEGFVDALVGHRSALGAAVQEFATEALMQRHQRQK